jgi:hypothetical protein
MHRWDMNETRALVLRLHGKSQLECARPSLRSVADRLIYARIHIQALEAAIKTYLLPERREQEFFEIILTDSGDAWPDFNQFLREIGAHATAGIQSLHAIGDLLSHAIYYSCAMDVENPIKERGISVDVIVRRLSGKANAINLCKLHATFGSKGDFQHLAALSNRAKHRSLVLPSLTEDLTGQGPERLFVLMQAFDHDAANFPAVNLLEFLVSQFEAVGRRANEVGNELNDLLRRS